MSLKCYAVASGAIYENTQASQCGYPNASTPYVNCCWKPDFCMSNDICHYTHAQIDGSGYYLAGCTDPTWKDPSCPPQCFDAAWPDIVYNQTTSLWACCTTYPNNTKICQQPTEETWQAPAPPALVTLGSVPIAAQATASSTPTPSFSPTTTSASSTTSAAITATPAPDLAPSGGLTSGAKAGIGVGVAVGVLLLLALGIFVWLRRARRARRQREDGDAQWDGGAGSQVVQQPGQDMVYTQQPGRDMIYTQDKPGVQPATELWADGTPELGTDGMVELDSAVDGGSKMMSPISGGR